MTTSSDVPLTRDEFLKALTAIHERFDGIDKTLALIVKSQNLIVETLQIQDRQISERKPVGVVASRGR